MIVHRQIQFDEHERDDIVRALSGICGDSDQDDDAPTNVLRRFLNSSRSGEAFAAARLDQILDALLIRIAELHPQTTTEWWYTQGAPTWTPEAVAGLARERAFQIERLDELQTLVSEACATAGPRSQPRAERKLVGV